ncbi:MAG: hypothetical protein OEV78_11855 [Spirochaetia bacterium]|nr:hypothetical protein [Spirochaetia bacterium]
MKEYSFAKITAPKSVAFIRSRLFKQLDEAKKYKLVWITAPAGSGKTTLISSYLAESKISHIWYQMDETDNDLASFFYYLGLAARKAAGRKKINLPLLTPEYLPGIAVFVRRFFEELFKSLKIPAVIVFDNYQDISHASSFNDSIIHGLNSIPDGVTVIIISRIAPPITFSRLLVNYRLQCIEWSDIRFTFEEYEELIKKQELKINRQLLEILYKKTEGWVVGLLLAAKVNNPELPLSISNQSSLLFQSEEIFNYFAGEVLKGIDEKMQNFLLWLALLPGGYTENIAKGLTGEKNAASILSLLYRDHFFIEKLQISEMTYVFHPLFREFLLAEAKKIFSEKIFDQKIKTAACLLEQTGKIDDAITLYLSAKCLTEASSLIEKHAREYLFQGRTQTLDVWLGQFPDEFMKQSPWLVYWKAFGILTVNPPGSTAIFIYAYELFKEKNDVTGQYLAWAGISDSILYSWDNFTKLDQWIDEFEKLRLRCPDFPSVEIETLVASSIFGALLYRKPDHDKLVYWEKRLDKLIYETYDYRLRVNIKSSLLFYCLWTVKWPKMIQLMETLPSDFGALEIYPQAQLVLSISEAMCYWGLGEIAKANEVIDRGLAIGDKTGIHHFDFLLLSQKLTCALYEGELVTAANLDKKIKPMLSTSHRLGISNYFYHTSCEAFLRNDIPCAHERIQTAISLAEELGTPIPLLFNYLSQSIVYAELDHFKKAYECICKANDINVLVQSSYLKFLSLINEAWLELKQKNEPKTIVLLKEAFSLGKKYNYKNVPWRIPAMMSRLCGFALNAEIEREYTESWIQKWPLEPPDVQAREKWPWLFKIKTIGRFEILKEGKAVDFSKKAPQTPLALLKAIIALGIENVSVESIVDALWPDTEGDHALNNFGVSLNRLRKLLGNDQLIELSGGRITLNSGLCSIDVLDLKQAMNQVRIVSDNLPRNAEDFKKYLDRSLNLYFSGEFLSGDERYSWVFSVRENLSFDMRQILLKTAAWYEKVGEPRQELFYLEKVYGIDNTSEEIVQRLMLCHFRLDHKIEAVRLYQQWEKRILATFGTKPGQKSREIYQSILNS